jgi:LPXTG-motif cell wall-anchored protein
MRFRKLAVSAAVLAAAVLGVAQPAHATYNKVVVCKWVGTPGDGEVLQTGDNPIVVSVNALEGKGFDGTFPFEFEDAQGRSVAIRYSENPQDKGDISECTSDESPTPTTPPPTSPPPTTPPPTTPPPTTQPPKHSHTPTWTPTWHPTFHPTNGARPPGQHPTAFTGSNVTMPAIAAGLLALVGGGAFLLRKRITD